MAARTDNLVAKAALPTWTPSSTLHDHLWPALHITKHQPRAADGVQFLQVIAPGMRAVRSFFMRSGVTRGGRSQFLSTPYRLCRPQPRQTCNAHTRRHNNENPRPCHVHISQSYIFVRIAQSSQSVQGSLKELSWSLLQWVVWPVVMGGDPPHLVE